MLSKIKAVVSNYYVRLLAYATGLGISFDHMGSFYSFEGGTKENDYSYMFGGGSYVPNHWMFSFNNVNGFALAGAILFLVLMIKTILEGKK